jgi:hypothetical protein
MAHTDARGRPTRYDEPASGWGVMVVFAGVLLAVVGCFQLMSGFAALVNDDALQATPRGLVFSDDLTLWGWIHMALGVLLIAAGAALFSGRAWARMAAVVVAGLSALANLLFMPAHPVWSVLVISFDVLVIYAVVVHGGRAQAAR